MESVNNSTGDTGVNSQDPNGAVDLVELPGSPKFPSRVKVSFADVITRPLDEQRRSDSPDYASQESLTVKGSSRKRNPVLNYSRTSPDKTLPSNQTTRRSKSKSPSSESDSRFEKLAAKDLSMLERISKRAQRGSERVRKPHEVFIELEELRLDSTGWEETARWIKFEEDVEEGSGRWGRPHVSALTFHSLGELRRGLNEGLVLLDVEGEDFPSIAREIVDSLVDSGQLPQEQKELVQTILLKKHKHSNDTTLWEKLKKSAADPDGTLHHIGEGLRIISHSPTTADLSPTRRKSLPAGNHTHDLERGSGARTQRIMSVPSLVPEDQSNDTKVDLDSRDSGNNSVSSDHNLIGTDESRDGLGEEDQDEPSLGSRHRNKSIVSLMDKIPDEAESLTVLVGGVNFLEKPIVAFVRLQQSHLLGDLTEVPVPVRFVYLLLGPVEAHCDYHEVGRAVATLMSDSRFHDEAYTAVNKNDFLEAMDEFLDDTLVLPPGDWDEDLLLPIMEERNQLRRRKKHEEKIESFKHETTPDPLKHSRRLCGGILRDLKKLFKRYPSDFRDALHIQPLVSIIFLYISFIAPAIAFGGLMEEITSNAIGETETMLATGLCGIVYALFSVQPMSVLAFTGPLLLFETVIFRFAVDYLSIPYLEWRAVTSLWLMILLVLAAITEVSFIVKYFTRFSEEVFTGIISLFFIYETCASIYHVFERNPLCGIHYPCGEAAHYSNTCVPLHDNSSSNYSDFATTMTTIFMNESADEAVHPTLPRSFRVCNQPNTGLWSAILCVLTFFIALSLRKFRHSKLFGKQGRRLVSDFGMLTAILLMVLLAYLLRDLIAIEVLVMPPSYGTSNPSRGWFINPFNGTLGVEAIIGAIIPAVLLCILIFIENQLSVIFINKPELKLKKKGGYHFDLLIVAFLTGVSGLLGMPWLCAAPIRSFQHLQALSVYSTKNPPGEKPRLLFVREQRVTTLIVHAMIILTPLAYVVLAIVPISVALGVLFYLSYASLNGVQLTKRVQLLFTPPKHHPEVHYVKKVRTWKMHLYTIIQIICIACLFGIKNSPAGMLYPLVILVLVPLRWILGKFVFSHDEIEALDSEEDHPENRQGGSVFGEFAAHVPY